MPSYENFDLRVRADGDQFQVAASVGSQRANASLAVDLSRSWKLRDLERDGRDAIRRRGAELFDGLIRGDIRDLYLEASGRVSGNASAGIRIRLHFDPHDPRLRPVIRLPWEIAVERKGGREHLLAIDRQRPIVRTIDSFEPVGNSEPGRFERVMLVLANPDDSARLEIERECGEIKKALAVKGLSPVVLQQTNRIKLIDAISRLNAQVMHFMGHGTLDEKSGEGAFLLEGDFGSEDPLDASTLATWFVGARVPRLVILAACLTASTGDGAEPLAAMAVALAAAGVPAVVAMQSEVTDSNANRFSSSLYRGLMDGEPIEAAVADARRAASEGRIEMLDWAAPVLFVRGQESAPVLARPDLPERLPGVHQTIHSGQVGTQINIASYHPRSEKK